MLHFISNAKVNISGGEKPSLCDGKRSLCWLVSLFHTSSLGMDHMPHSLPFVLFNYSISPKFMLVENVISAIQMHYRESDQEQRVIIQLN